MNICLRITKDVRLKMNFSNWNCITMTTEETDFYDLFASQVLRDYHKKIGFEFTPEQEFFLIYSQGIFKDSMEKLDQTKSYLKNTLLPKTNNKRYRKMIKKLMFEPLIKFKASNFKDEDNYLVEIPIPFKHGEIVIDRESMFKDNTGVIEINECESDDDIGVVYYYYNLFHFTYSGYIGLNHMVNVMSLDYPDFEISPTSSIVKMQKLLNQDNYSEIVNKHWIGNKNKGAVPYNG